MRGDLCRMLRDVVGELQSKRNQADGEFYKRQREADALQYYLKAEADGWANQVLVGLNFFLLDSTLHTVAPMLSLHQVFCLVCSNYSSVTLYCHLLHFFFFSFFFSRYPQLRVLNSLAGNPTQFVLDFKRIEAMQSIANGKNNSTYASFCRSVLFTLQVLLPDRRKLHSRVQNLWRPPALWCT